MPIKDALRIYAVRDRAEFDVKQAAYLRRNKVVVRPQPGMVDAYVNDNRWVADCPECSAGIGLLEDAATAVCWECGSQWDVGWPDDKPSAVEVLEVRPARNRHWRPDFETVDDLRAENEAHADELIGGR